eukprot:SAG11_NODE_2190_length_3706_cov_28.760189_2_plen_664_part_00
MTLMKVVVMVPLFALFCVGGASKSVDVVSPGLKQMWEHFDKKVSSLENDLQEEKQLRTDMQGQIDELKGRVDRCESRDKEVEESPFIRRRNQEQQSSVCGVEAVQSMLAVCCASESPGNGHRLQEIEGCDTLPPTCSLECSSQFISIFENCQEEPLMEGLTAEDMDEWNEFYTDCSEVQQSAAEMGVLQPVNVRMFRIMISSDAPQSQAAMFGNGGSSPAPPLGPLPPISDGNTACWSGAYTVERCCDVTRGPTGDMSCWSGSFDFEFCCPSPVSPPPPAPSPDSSSTDLEQYHAQCTTANILSCVPECNATHHGFELLATIDGTDTKFSCNLANMLFSWVGAAALGGFLGQNVAAFVSAVISGAAGTYVLTLTEDADVGTDLVIQPGQNVIISGDAGLAEAPRWGSGGFTVGEMGPLALTGFIVVGAIAVHDSACMMVSSMILGGVVTVQSGANVTIDGDTFGGEFTVQSGGSLDLRDNVVPPLVTAAAGATIMRGEASGGAAICAALVGHYATLNDAWRATTNTEDTSHNDCGNTPVGWLPATGVGGGRWYRFVGTGGDALPLTAPGYEHCGTNWAGWLSGWDVADERGTPNRGESTQGRYPVAAEGVVEMTVCFDGALADDDECTYHITVGVVHCDGYLLWRLAYAPYCGAGYCTTSSGL